MLLYKRQIDSCIEAFFFGFDNKVLLKIRKECF